MPINIFDTRFVCRSQTRRGIQNQRRQKSVIYELHQKPGGNKGARSSITLSYRIVVAHQISVALGTLSKINKRSPSNKRSLGKFQKI